MEHVEAMRFARDTIHSVKRDAAVKDEAGRVYTKHGSRHPQRERPTGYGKKRSAARKSDANNVTMQLAFAWETTGDG